jgi:membrane protein YqaA with SNARE-associated domain
MRRFVTGVEAFALALGAPGLFVLGLLDSSFLSLPEVPDALLVLMVTHAPARMPLYALSATLGSLLGCFILYYIGRKGGDAFVRRRIGAARVDRAVSVFNRYGVLAILIPALLPPPAPFKVFVLLAGVAGISPSRFVVAITIGRGIRYFGEGALALWYGPQALDWMEANGRTASLVLVGLCLGLLLAIVLWRKVRAGNGR